MLFIKFNAVEYVLSQILNIDKRGSSSRGFELSRVKLEQTQGKLILV